MLLQSLTTSCQFDMWKYAVIHRSDVHPLLTNPSAPEPYYTISVWHVEKCRHTWVRCTQTPPNHPGWYRAILNHASLACGRVQVYPGQMYIPLQIKPSYTELNYSMSVWYVIAWRCTQVRWNPPTPPANRTSCYRVLVHHVSLKCGKIQMYPGQM